MALVRYITMTQIGLVLYRNYKTIIMKNECLYLLLITLIFASACATSSFGSQPEDSAEQEKRNRQALVKAIAKGNYELVGRIVESNPEILSQNIINLHRPLSWALVNHPSLGGDDEQIEEHQKNMDAVVKILLENGADPYNDLNGKLALTHVAYQTGRLTTMQVFLDNGYNINQLNEEGAGHVLEGVVDAATFKWLIDKGADINVYDDKGGSLIHQYAFQMNRSAEEYKNILNSVDDEDPVFKEILLNLANSLVQQVELFQAALDAGADVKVKSKSGETVYDLCYSSIKDLPNKLIPKKVLDAIKSSKSK